MCGKLEERCLKERVLIDYKFIEEYQVGNLYECSFILYLDNLDDLKLDDILVCDTRNKIQASVFGFIKSRNSVWCTSSNRRHEVEKGKIWNILYPCNK